RYAYNNQPNVGLWNLTRFAECLLHLIDEDVDTAVDIAKQRLERFIGYYKNHWLSGMRTKLGFKSSLDVDEALIEELLDIMASSNADFTLTFYQLSRLDTEASNDDAILALFDHDESFARWLTKWRSRIRQESSDNDERKAMMCGANPVYIPRNHLIEAAIRAAEDQGDFSVFLTLHEVLQQPYEYQPGKEIYMLPPQPHEVVRQTFCGT
ncbi:MAG: YdiU family protein, partial [Gammaproteobacteria bacterium]|nr:YdiU family protein [Gammaproteobacteria bacterium]